MKQQTSGSTVELKIPWTEHVNNDEIFRENGIKNEIYTKYQRTVDAHNEEGKLRKSDTYRTD